MRPQTIVEKLDFVAKRIPGLKFTPPTQLKPGDDQCYGCFMSCDMYYIEIKVDQSHQSVKDVIISHGNNAEGISCPVLRKVLAEQDFETFAKHLSGLHSIYQISTNDKKVKQRAYPALTALESDLIILYDHQRRRTSDCHYLVHKSPIGIMEPRRGGLPVRLTYFVTPYDLIDTTLKGQINLTIQNVIEKSIGLSATVEIEGSSQHKIQVKSLISNQINSSLPIYAPFNGQNSEKLPAQFVLNLSQPFPMLNSSINQIVYEINTEPATIKDYLLNLTSNSKESIINLIARQELDLNKGPFNRSVDLYKQSDAVGDGFCDLKRHVYSIKLQNQMHTYHILDNHLERPEGVYVTKIPFTHPTSIPSILKILRQQALFNFVIGSCIRRSGKSNNTINTISNYASSSSLTNLSSTNLHNGNIFDETNNNSIFSPEMNIFDVVPVNLNNICISFEHPSKESLATLEIDLRTISEPNCLLHALENESVCSNEFATKVLQKCWSIPITLRSVLRKCNERRLALLEDANVRREREIQELIANNSQQTLQYKTPYQYQDEHNSSSDMIQQTSFNYNNSRHDIISQDLNTKTVQQSVGTTKLGAINNFGANTSHASNQTIINLTTDDESATRSNLLKKFSCKPKAKQNLTQNKNQSGNKTILSLMLKRQNPTQNSSADASIKATTNKKKKLSQPNTNSVGSLIPVANSSNVTKVISLDTASATKLANKPGIKLGGPQNLSLSLIRSPNKSSTINNQTINPHGNNVQTIGLNLQSLASTNKSNDLNNLTVVANNNLTNSRLPKLQNSNMNSNIIPPIIGTINNGKNRKDSIGAVIDYLVTGLNPEQQQQQAVGLLPPNTNTVLNNNNEDSKNSLKSKTSRAPSDQFAIKQGSSGGLKLTVTKTKPSIASATTNSTSPSPLSALSSINNSNNNIGSQNTSTLPNATSATANTNNETTSKSSATSKPDTNPLLNLGPTAPIKYTIPKISKTQSTNQPNSSAEGPSQSNDNSQPQSKSDDTTSTSPNFTGTNNINSQTTTPSSSTSSNINKRSTPFGRSNNISNRNNSSVSSSTHPPSRTTSNPLANHNSNRATSTNSNDNHPTNRITSSAVNSQQNRQNQQSQLNRPMINLQQQLQSSNIQRLLASNSVQPQIQPTPIFPHSLNPQIRHPLPVQNNTTDINILAMNQVAILQQQQQQQQGSLQTNQNPNSQSTAGGGSSFMSSSLDVNLISSSRPTPGQFHSGVNIINSNQTTSSSLATPDVSSTGIKTGLQPQFYMRQPMFVDDPQQQQQLQQQSQPKIASSTSTLVSNTGNDNEVAKSNCETNRNSMMIQPNVSSSCDSSANPLSSLATSSKPGQVKLNETDAQAISDPSSPTEPNMIEAVEPPPLIPIDSIHDPVQASSPEVDQPDDCSDRLSIIDTNEQMDCSSPPVGFSPKPSTDEGSNQRSISSPNKSQPTENLATQ